MHTFSHCIITISPLSISTGSIRLLASLDPMIFRFKIDQFPFKLSQIPFDSQFLPVSLPFSHFSHQNNACVVWSYGSFLQFYYLWSYFWLKRLDFQSHVVLLQTRNSASVSSNNRKSLALPVPDCTTLEKSWSTENLVVSSNHEADY